MDNSKKCIAVNLDQTQVNRIQKIKEVFGKSQSRITAEAVTFGLNNASFFLLGKSLFLVTVRIDTGCLAEFGEKLQNGELHTDRYLFTYCRKNDPTVGTSLWIADDRKHLDELIEPHARYYQEVLSVEEVITPEESLRLIMESSH